MRLVRGPIDAASVRACALVPTMGALHDGHVALIAHARALAHSLAAPVVVTVFVNPTQFNDPADLARYPRTLEADAALAERAGADVLLAPSVEDVYPPGALVPVGELPDVALKPGLEDALRPGHFAGVVQVVRRLFALTLPALAVFGEKDWQQLQVVRAMAARERLGVRVEPCPTVREPDGLALSSRNRFLSADERRRAGAIWRALRAAGPAPSVAAAERAMRAELERAGLDVEYAAVRDAASLAPLDPGGALRADARALIAARLGSVRLIDNAPWPLREAAR